MGTRVANIVLAIGLFCYGSYMLVAGQVAAPEGGAGFFHDVPAWIRYGGYVALCLMLVSRVLDHYDKRDNESVYRTFEEIAIGAAIVLFAGATIYCKLDNM